ncbi:hypothetical protein AB0P17_18905 [Streptomyces sp. NPDC088124]|uniref:type II toxin-antitoxin system RelE family toxin n=1 Tax=Streptomyces sp. NPDC088124 TaxID=3154654 RepID=UPI0034442222
MTDYRVQFTVEARTTYDALPGERRSQLDKALRVLSRDPFHKTATAQLGPDEHLRKAYVAPGVVLEYMVAGAIMVIVVLEIFDENHYLIDDSDA